MDQRKEAVIIAGGVSWAFLLSSSIIVYTRQIKEMQNEMIPLTALCPAQPGGKLKHGLGQVQGPANSGAPHQIGV